MDTVLAKTKIKINELAVAINAAHRAATEQGWGALQQVLECGRLLIEAKRQIAHGEWLPWLEANFEAEPRLAQYYMQVYNKRTLLSNTKRVSYLTLRGALSLLKPHVGQSTGENEWYTPVEYVEAARKVMGGIDCDPASTKLGNRTIKAMKFYTKEDNGLIKVWAKRVWLNPPYAQPLIAQFAEGLVSRLESGEIEQACVLVNNATETDWFQILLMVCEAACFLKGRVRFLDSQGNPGAPLQGQVILYVGKHLGLFKTHFKNFGVVLTRNE